MPHSDQTPLKFLPLGQAEAERYRAGGRDANGMAPERHVSRVDIDPCRCCLGPIPAERPYLVLAHRPFPAPQPYAEVGPIFLCAVRCRAHPPEDGLPPLFLETERYLLRGYGADHRIVYGTGQTPPSADMEAVARAILGREDVAYAHVRSATNNCYQCRIELG